MIYTTIVVYYSDSTAIRATLNEKPIRMSELAETILSVLGNEGTTESWWEQSSPGHTELNIVFRAGTP